MQSISSWAPSCIGPYSQANVVHGLAYFAGQIGLNPPTMQLLRYGGARAQAARCLISCQAVATAVRCDLPNALLSATVYAATSRSRDSISAGNRDAADALRESAELLHAMLNRDWQTLSMAMQRGDDSSAAGRHPGALQNADISSSEKDVNDVSSTSIPELDEAEEEEDDALLDDYLRPPEMRRSWQPLETYVMMPALPKGASVELQPLALSLLGQEADAMQGRLETH